MSEDTPTTDSTNAARSLPWNRWLNVMIILILAGLAVALLLPAIQQSRKAAHRSQTKNNLKNIGLSLANYHDVHRVFPPGGTIDSNNRGHHGWTFQIMPFIDATPFFRRVDSDTPWDIAPNRYQFQKLIPYYQVPGVAEVVTTEGFPVTHVMANPAVMFRNSSVSFSDFENGASNVWLVGEVGGDYQPWGYPFNWRELSGPLNESTKSYGRPEEYGAMFVLADGSVRFFSSTISDALMPSEMMEHPPVPDQSLRVRPPRKFEVTDETGVQSHQEIVLDRGSESEQVVVHAIVLADGRVEFLEIRSYSKLNFHPPTFGHLRKVLAKYPSAEQVLLPVALDDQVAELLTTLPELTHVYAQSVSLSERGAKSLCGIPSLKVLLVQDLDDPSAEHIARCHPDFEIRRGRVR